MGTAGSNNSLESPPLAKSHKTWCSSERIGDSHGCWLVLSVTPSTTHNEALADTQRIQPNTHTHTLSHRAKQPETASKHSWDTLTLIRHSLAHKHILSQSHNSHPSCFSSFVFSTSCSPDTGTWFTNRDSGAIEKKSKSKWDVSCSQGRTLVVGWSPCVSLCKH